METSKTESLNFEEIIDRVAVIMEIEQGEAPQNKQIAHTLGLSSTNFSNAKKRNKIPYLKLLEFAHNSNASLEYILSGRSTCSRNDHLYKIENLKKRHRYLAEYLQTQGKEYLIYDQESESIIEDMDRIVDIYNRSTYIKQKECYITIDEEAKRLIFTDIRNGCIYYDSRDTITAVGQLLGTCIDAYMKIDYRDYSIDTIDYNEENSEGSEYLLDIIINYNNWKNLELY